MRIPTLKCRVQVTALAKWIRDNRPDLDVVLAGTVRRAVNAAHDLCESGSIPKPYDPQRVPLGFIATPPSPSARSKEAWIGVGSRRGSTPEWLDGARQDTDLTWTG